MKCPSCSNEMYVDHTELSEDGKVQKYFYVCVNPRCSGYRKAIALTGEEVEAQIQPKGAK